MLTWRTHSTYFESWIDFVLWVTCKKFSNKANSHRGCHIGFNYRKGTGDNLHIEETWMSSQASSFQLLKLENLLRWSFFTFIPSCLFLVWLIVLVECPLTLTCPFDMAMNREKGERPNQFLNKWLKESGWLQTRGSGVDLLMIKLERGTRSRVDAKNFHFNAWGPQFDRTCGSEDPDWKILVPSLAFDHYYSYVNDYHDVLSYCLIIVKLKLCSWPCFYCFFVWII